MMESSFAYFGVWDYIVNWIMFMWMKDLDWTYNKNGMLKVIQLTTLMLLILSILCKFHILTRCWHMVPMNQPENALAMIQQLTVAQGW